MTSNSPSHTPPTPAERSTEAQLENPSRKGLTPYLIVLVTIIILAVALTVYPNKLFDRSAATQVAIDSSQFSPEVVYVKAGTAVTWTNNDNQEHQVAADPFPKDNSIPGLDNTIVLKPHETLKFAFESKGTYSYHDEMNPYQLKGTVIVR